MLVVVNRRFGTESWSTFKGQAIEDDVKAFLFQEING